MYVSRPYHELHSRRGEGVCPKRNRNKISTFKLKIMAILRTHDDFIWLDVTERCINDEKTTTEIWLAHELHAVSVCNNDDVLLETYEEVVLAIENECLICIAVGVLPERGNRGQKGEPLKVD